MLADLFKWIHNMINFVKQLFNEGSGAAMKMGMEVVPFPNIFYIFIYI